MKIGETFRLEVARAIATAEQRHFAAEGGADPDMIDPIGDYTMADADSAAYWEMADAAIRVFANEPVDGVEEFKTALEALLLVWSTGTGQDQARAYLDVVRRYRRALEGGPVENPTIIPAREDWKP